ncbi:hypothetical protein V502_00494 [Pseudogymnoascus sp. VKM F-4520 (FW-2644)]|nr:hypothetical protein V502_00494 [Pseudogymnoascus sp. VKM F-4520 (FW-2644)]
MGTVEKTGEYERYRVPDTTATRSVILDRVAIVREIKKVWQDIHSDVHLEGVPWAGVWAAADTGGKRSMAFTRAAILAARQKIENENRTGKIVPCPPGEQRALAMLIQKLALDCTRAKSECGNVPTLEALTSVAAAQKLGDTGLTEKASILVKLAGFNNYPGDMESLCFHSVMSHHCSPDDVKFYAYGWTVKASGPNCGWYKEYDMTTLCGTEHGHRAGILGVWHMFLCVHGLCRCSIECKDVFTGDSTLDTIITACMWPQAVRVAILDIELTVEQEIMYNVYVTYGNAMYSVLRDLMHDSQHSLLWLMPGTSWHDKVLALIEDVISLSALVCDLNKVSLAAGSACMGCFAAGLLMRRYSILDTTAKSFRTTTRCTRLCSRVVPSTIANIALELAQSNTRVSPSPGSDQCSCDALIDEALSTMSVIAAECPVIEVSHTITAMYDLAMGHTANMTQAYDEINSLFVFMMSSDKRSTCVVFMHSAAFLAMIIAYVNIMRRALNELNTPIPGSPVV